MKKQTGFNTLCVHKGQIKDEQFKGAISPLYMATTYAYNDMPLKQYPRYFNTPNQMALSRKIAALEQAEDAVIFASGMAAESTALLSFLQKGDHIVLQRAIYGGTFNLIQEVFGKFGIEWSFTNGREPHHFEEQLQENTKAIYIETPSNPLLHITDIEALASLAKKKGLVSIIDNTFASPVNQNPFTLGIDIVLHSATKYLGGHSDIQAGAVAASKTHIAQIKSMAKNLGGSLSDYTVWLLDRSIKTLGLRVERQNQNALKMARLLEQDNAFKKVFYPGLESHSGYETAKRQMNGFGGVLSFELQDVFDPVVFVESLGLIKPVMSLAGVESTILSPALTSHYLLSAEERQRQGISDSLLRLSMGIENTNDLLDDIKQALKMASKSKVTV